MSIHLLSKLKTRQCLNIKVWGSEFGLPHSDWKIICAEGTSEGTFAAVHMLRLFGLPGRKFLFPLDIWIFSFVNALFGCSIRENSWRFK